jgi:molybdenum cofactor cytidylyltransferase
MVATVKVIPYAVAGAAVAHARAALNAGALRVERFGLGSASLILTRTPGLKESLITKGAEVIAARLASLGHMLGAPAVVPHTIDAVAGALAAAQGDMVLVLGGSATSDAADVCPAAVIAAGGKLDRFGMPVDPGNLLFLGRLGHRAVVGLPGCARSPALNGADWVLERLAAGLEVTGADIAGMGVGGLLKEIPTRAQPRAGAAPAAAPGRPRVAAILLAAGAARRMRGRDKLLEALDDGRPVLRYAAEAALASQAGELVVVLPPAAAPRRAALAGTRARIVEAPEWAEGMAASLRTGLAAVAPETDAVVVLLADMPEVGARDIDRLIAAFDPAEGRELCRAVTAEGVPGHPVLFGRRFFETLAALSGDRGAREVLREAAE